MHIRWSILFLVASFVTWGFDGDTRAHTSEDGYSFRQYLGGIEEANTNSHHELIVRAESGHDDKTHGGHASGEAHREHNIHPHQDDSPEKLAEREDPQIAERSPQGECLADFVQFCVAHRPAQAQRVV